MRWRLFKWAMLLSDRPWTTWVLNYIIALEFLFAMHRYKMMTSYRIIKIVKKNRNRYDDAFDAILILIVRINQPLFTPCCM